MDEIIPTLFIFSSLLSFFYLENIMCQIGAKGATVGFKAANLIEIDEN